jgi:very-short-patch-repair endonuclease
MGCVVADAIERLAARQLGLVTRAELLAAGLKPKMIDGRVRAGRLLLVHRGVYRVGPVVVPHARELAAVLACAPGATLSHVSAGALRSIVPDAGDGTDVDVAVRLDRGRRPGIRAHRIVLQSDEITLFDGVPVTTPERTLLDLSSVLALRELERALARAERAGIFDCGMLRKLIERYPRRRGVVALRTLLAGDAPPALTRSDAEERLLTLVRQACLPAPATNTAVGKHEVDFLWRNERLVVEVDGFEFHSSRSRFENDRRRDADLTAAGFRVMRVTWRHLVDTPLAVLARVVRALSH